MEAATYVVLPFFGPSDNRHAIGFVADEAVKPWNMHIHTPSPPMAPPTTRRPTKARKHDGSQSESDSYALINTRGHTARRRATGLAGPWADRSAHDANPRRGARQPPGTGVPQPPKQTSVRIPTTGRRLKFNYWLQPGPAPLVYVSPGLSSHRLSLTTLSVAEHLHRNGFSVVTTTSVFHPEFMENASTAALPVYPPVDSRDLWSRSPRWTGCWSAGIPEDSTKRALVGLFDGRLPHAPPRRE